MPTGEKHPTKPIWEAQNWESSVQRLYWWDEVPTQLQYNKFIRSGYRAGAISAEFNLHLYFGNMNSRAPEFLCLIATQMIPFGRDIQVD